MPYAGVKEDVESLLSRVRLEFDRNCCLGFDLFAEHFRDMKFSLIFCGRQVGGVGGRGEMGFLVLF